MQAEHNNVTEPEPTRPTPDAAPPTYVPPEVTTYSDAALLEALGPARAGGTYLIFGGP